MTVGRSRADTRLPGSKQPGPWTALTVFGTNWENLTSDGDDEGDFYTLAYRRHSDGTIELRGGTDADGVPGTTIFTLPAEARPANAANIAVPYTLSGGSQDARMLFINAATGTVTFAEAAYSPTDGDSYSFDGITFPGIR